MKNLQTAGSKRVLLTGATGYVGRHVLASLLNDGQQVTAVVRRRGALLEERLKSFVVSFDGPLRVLEGDVSLPNFGMDAGRTAGLAGRFDAMVHCAGLTEFDAGLEPQLRRQNVEGTRYAADLCLALKISHFHHVSTAFVAGISGGVFSSRDTGDGRKFRNPYEASKAEAERLLRAKSTGPTIVSVYRPSIVVGGRVLGEDGTAGTLYAYLKSLWFIRECMVRDAEKNGTLGAKYGASFDGRTWNIPLRIEASADLRINLIHVEDVAAVIAGAVRRPPGAGGVCNVVSRSTFLSAEIKDEFCRVLGVRGVRLVPDGTFRHAPANGLEEKFARMTDAFRPYRFSMPSFESDIQASPVSPARIAEEFLSELETKRGLKNPLGSMAPDCLDVARPDRYLDKFSDGEFGASLLKRIPFVEATVRFRILGRGDATRTLVFENGAVRHASGGDGAADFTYEMEETVFRRVISGELDPREAFFGGSLRIEGDQEKALKFGYTFTEHFQNIDGRILEELEESGK